MEATDQFLSHEYGITFRTSSGALVRKAYKEEFEDNRKWMSSMHFEDNDHATKTRGGKPVRHPEEKDRLKNNQLNRLKKK